MDIDGQGWIDNDPVVNAEKLRGTELFISEKTASVHVSNILRKLGVTSRVDAAAVAQRLGIA